MSRARDTANFDPALFTADEVSGDKVHGGTISGSPVLVTPNIGTPNAGVATNLTGIPAANVTGVLPVGVTGGTGLTAIAGVTTGSGDVTITNGNLVIGTSGKGIDFSAETNDAAGMTSELLDDYEEGTCTLYSENGGVSSYGNQTAHYTKIGRKVTVTFYSTTWACSSAVSAVLTGLPFNNNSTVNSHSAVVTTYGTWNTNSSSGMTAPSNNKIYFMQVSSTTASSTPASGDAYIILQATYFTA